MSSHAIASPPSLSIVGPPPSTDHIVQLFHTLVEEAREYGIILLDADGFVASWNAGAARMTGYADTEIIGRHFSCFYPLEAVQEGLPAMALEKALAHGKFAEEGWRVRRDGSRLWANVLMTPVRDQNGNLTGFTRLVQDATEARLARLSLLESEQRYAALFANRLNAIAHCRVIVDQHGQPIDFVFLRINDAYERIIGIKRADIEGRRMKEVFPDETYTFDYIGELGKVACDRTEFSTQTYFEPTKQYLSIYAYSPLPAEFTVMFSDVTEHKRAEEAIQKSRDQLELRVRQRTQELSATNAALSDQIEERKSAEDALLETVRQLEDALSEKTFLLKEVHHRVKNNLQVVCSLLSMQIRATRDKDVASPLIAAHSRALAMSLVHEQVYQSQSAADLDFGRYIEQLAEQVFRAYCVDPKRIQLERNIEPISLDIEDAVPCGLILNELLSNSLKHAFVDGRQGVIRVSFKRTGGREVECSVSDNGPGLPPDFDLRQSQSLGMQIVASLIRQLRAYLLTSSDGGAVFRFRWRCANPVAEKPPA